MKSGAQNFDLQLEHLHTHLTCMYGFNSEMLRYEWNTVMILTLSLTT
jgi:hypothetical protein